MEILTDREFEIFQLIGEGMSPKEIARQLHLSAKTVAVHNANIRQKLSLKSTAQLDPVRRSIGKFETGGRLTPVFTARLATGF